MYRWLIWKRKIEDIFIFPFVLIGRWIARRSPLRKEFDLFLFFPFHHVGGAEKVHAAIARSFPDKKVAVFFTRHSQNELLLPEFKGDNITIYNIARYTDNKLLYFLNLTWRGVIAEYINRQAAKPVVFNGQCNFAYKLSPHLRSDIRQVELLHLKCNFSYIRLPFLPFYDATVMISHDAINEHLAIYRRFSVPASYDARLHLIINGVDLPEDTSSQAPEGVLSVLFSGRGTRQKRPELVAMTAKLLSERGHAISISMLGPVESAIPAGLRQYVRLFGETGDAKEIDLIYRSHQVILLTSAWEGFPMVVMEAMARGLAVVSTDVGDTPYHVKHMENGLLTDHTLTDEALVAQTADYLGLLAADPALLAQMRIANIAYAKAHFGTARFTAAYRQLLLGEHEPKNNTVTQ